MKYLLLAALLLALALVVRRVVKAASPFFGCRQANYTLMEQ